ncbi:pectinesterase family protein [Parasediminibacterium sp. JCM 36343]|uniref:pectinesterase family protein n=1 Tax=Parasediminibacterium sp. JCM 36343 TaxID=3374279 RepID=UPI00397DE99A
MLKRIALSCCALVSCLVILNAQKPSFPKDITVATDGSGNYLTIQEAINSVRDLGAQRVTIHIRKGIYHEKLIVPSWKTNISLIGDDKETTIITNSDYSGKANLVGKDAFGKDKFTTYTSYTLLVEGSDFIAENLTIENAAGAVGQAVALHVGGDRCIIRNCKLLGHQDTLYATNENSRQLYQNCYIEGTTDFIFGTATAVFQNCVIKSLANSFITAASTTPRQRFGFVLLDCKLIADTSVKKVFLGRPWRPYAKTVYIHCELGSHITPEGWNPWRGDAMFPDKDKTAYYAEYGNSGEGAATNNRVAWAKQLTAYEVKEYTIANILGGADYWDALGGK